MIHGLSASCALRFALAANAAESPQLFVENVVWKPVPADAVEGVEDAHGSVAILYPDHRVIFYQGALRRETATQRVVLMANVGAMVEAGRWTSRPSNQIEASMKICGLVNVIDRAAGGRRAEVPRDQKPKSELWMLSRDAISRSNIRLTRVNDNGLVGEFQRWRDRCFQ